MQRRMNNQLTRLGALGLMASVAALAGCGNDGYGGKDYGQEFEKPANATGEAGKTPDPPDAGEDASPRGRNRGGEG